MWQFLWQKAVLVATGAGVVVCGGRASSSASAEVVQGEVVGGIFFGVHIGAI